MCCDDFWLNQGFFSMNHGRMIFGWFLIYWTMGINKISFKNPSSIISTSSSNPLLLVSSSSWRLGVTQAPPNIFFRRWRREKIREKLTSFVGNIFLQKLHHEKCGNPLNSGDSSLKKWVNFRDSSTRNHLCVVYMNKNDGVRSFCFGVLVYVLTP